MITIRDENGQVITDWKNYKERNFLYGALSGLRRNCTCDLKGLPSGEPKPNSVFNIPRECEPPYRRLY